MPISNMLPWIILLSVVAFTAWWIFRPSARTRKTDSRVIMASTLLVIMSGSFVLWQSGFIPPIGDSLNDFENEIHQQILQEVIEIEILSEPIDLENNVIVSPGITRLHHPEADLGLD